MLHANDVVIQLYDCQTTLIDIGVLMAPTPGYQGQMKCIISNEHSLI